MLWVLIISWLTVAALTVVWGMAGVAPLFPLGAVAGVACLYFSWWETAAWVFSLCFLLESFLPLTPGSLCVPLTILTLALQLLARHQFRASRVSRVFLGVLLQTTVTVIYAFQWPPRTVAGVVEQFWGGLVSAAVAGAFCLLGGWALSAFCRAKTQIDLDSRLKDL